MLLNFRFLNHLCLDYTSTHAAKNFGYYRDLAQRKHVAIMHHGRPSVIMMSADEYCRLMSDSEAWEGYEKSVARRLRQQKAK